MAEGELPSMVQGQCLQFVEELQLEKKDTTEK